MASAEPYTKRGAFLTMEPYMPTLVTLMKPALQSSLSLSLESLVLDKAYSRDLVFGEWKIEFCGFPNQWEMLSFSDLWSEKKSYSDEDFSICTSHSGFMEIPDHIWLRVMIPTTNNWTTTLLSDPVLGTGDTRKDSPCPQGAYSLV